jgi:predicted O-methyltransferase YrrM
MPARWRSLFPRVLARRISPLAEAAFPAGRGDLEANIKQLGQEVSALRSLLAAQEDRAQRKLRDGLSSAVNLLAILPHLRIEGVLPPFPHTGFEVPGEMAAFLYHLIRRNRPRLVMELGSGSSTVLLAASVRANGFGRLISVEHDPEYRDRTAQFLRHTELSDWVDLIETPLVEQDFRGRSLKWYWLTPLLRTLSEKIDLLFIDGPPGRLQPLSRYPALPALAAHLSPHALVVVDDGQREDETRMIDLWRGLDISFETETLGFLPRSPVLLTVPASQDRFAELRRPREDRAAADEDDAARTPERRGRMS